MPLKPGTGKKAVNANTAILIREGRKPSQAYAIANSINKEREMKRERLGKKKQ
jgi:hypothetical protein